MDRVLQRDHRLDYLKGSCVLIMVLYHIMSMAVVRYNVDPVLSRLHFIHASFLFLSGVLVGQYYAVRVAEGQAVAVCRRLVIRGLRLCCLFLVLNVTVYASGMGYSLAELHQLDSVGEVARMLFLHPRGSLMAGEILWEIGLFLAAIAPLIALLPIRYFCLVGVALWIAGFWGRIPFFLSIGTWGILSGWYLRNRDYGKILRSRPIVAACIGIWLLYLVYVVQVVQISKQIPLLAMPLSMVEILSWFALFLIFHQSQVLPLVGRYCGFYGRYTLVAYCFQLILARVVAKAFHPDDFPSYFVIALVVYLLAMHWVLRAIDWAREKNWLVDHTYKVIFA
jgi:hypothetical protein